MVPLLTTAAAIRPSPARILPASTSTLPAMTLCEVPTSTPPVGVTVKEDPATRRAPARRRPPAGRDRPGRRRRPASNGVERQGADLEGFQRADGYGVGAGVDGDVGEAAVRYAADIPCGRRIPVGPMPAFQLRWSRCVPLLSLYVCVLLLWLRAPFAAAHAAYYVRETWVFRSFKKLFLANTNLAGPYYYIAVSQHCWVTQGGIGFGWRRKRAAALSFGQPAKARLLPDEWNQAPQPPRHGARTCAVTGRSIATSFADRQSIKLTLRNYRVDSQRGGTVIISEFEAPYVSQASGPHWVRSIEP